MNCFIPSFYKETRMTKLLGILVGILVVLAIIVAISAGFAALIWLAWKYVAVASFGAPALKFTQVWLANVALGVIIGAARGASAVSKG